MARYRDEKYANGPVVGEMLPAFIFAIYNDGSRLIYSHGTIDIWCVYHAKRLDGPRSGISQSQNYPLALDRIEVTDIPFAKARTSFKAHFAKDPSAAYEFNAPKDTDYLQELRDFGFRHGKDDAWSTFLELYDCIPQQREIAPSRKMTDKVLEIAARYPNEPFVRFTFDCLLAAMIAENNRLKKYSKDNGGYDTHLGKKVKALGAYQAIYETAMDIREVADFSKGMKWRVLDKECEKRGIHTPNMF